MVFQLLYIIDCAHIVPVTIVSPVLSLLVESYANGHVLLQPGVSSPQLKFCDPYFILNPPSSLSTKSGSYDCDTKTFLAFAAHAM